MPVTYAMYRKAFPAGPVVLGANEGSSSSDMYTVLIRTSAGAVGNLDPRELGPGNRSRYIIVDARMVATRRITRDRTIALRMVDLRGRTAAMDAERAAGVYLVRLRARGADEVRH
jgi:hypothetical protein